MFSIPCCNQSLIRTASETLSSSPTPLAAPAPLASTQSTRNDAVTAAAAVAAAAAAVVVAPTSTPTIVVDNVRDDVSFREAPLPGVAVSAHSL